MEEVVEQPVGHRPGMPHRLDHRFCTKMENHICDILVKEGVPLAHVREILREPYMFDILCILPRDMTLVMDDVVNALMLILRLRAHARSTSSSKNEVPNATHQDSLLAHALGGKSTTTYSPPHASSEAPSIDPPALLILHPPPPPPLHVSQASSSIDPPPHASPV